MGTQAAQGTRCHIPGAGVEWVTPPKAAPGRDFGAEMETVVEGARSPLSSLSRVTPLSPSEHQSPQTSAPKCRFCPTSGLAGRGRGAGTRTAQGPSPPRILAGLGAVWWFYAWLKLSLVAKLLHCSPAEPPSPGVSRCGDPGAGLNPPRDAAAREAANSPPRQPRCSSAAVQGGTGTGDARCSLRTASLLLQRTLSPQQLIPKSAPATAAPPTFVPPPAP